MRQGRLLLGLLIAAALPSEAFAAGLDGAHLQLGWALPFDGMLLSIALFPLLAPHFWEHHQGTIAAVWSVLVALPLALSAGIAPTAQDDSQTAAADVPVVTPRKVRTMIVKPDGSLVPREDPTPQVAASEPADPAPQHVGANDQTGTVAAADAGESALKPANAGADVTTPKMAPIAMMLPTT